MRTAAPRGLQRGHGDVVSIGQLGMSRRGACPLVELEYMGLSSVKHTSIDVTANSRRGSFFATSAKNPLALRVLSNFCRKGESLGQINTLQKRSSQKEDERYNPARLNPQGKRRNTLVKRRDTLCCLACSGTEGIHMGGLLQDTVGLVAEISQGIAEQTNIYWA